MRKLILIALALALATGCGKLRLKGSKTGQNAANQTQQGSGDQPAVHAPTGVVLNPGLGGGGSGGAAQAVRKAATRAVSQNELNNIRLFIENASLASGRMPSVEETRAALQREAAATFKLVEEGAIVLTGTRSRDGIWAYTAEAQSSVTGEHLIVNASGVQRMDPQTLRQRLQQGQ